MGSIEATKQLSVSPDALWKTVSDPSTWDQWFTIHEKWLQEPPSTLTEGATMTAKIVMLGMANKLEWTVDKVDAPTSLTMSGTGMAGVKCQFDFSITPSGDGSEFKVAGSFEGALVKGALAKAVEKDGAKQLEKTLAQLEALAAAAA
ncbi:type II toxin-antitoxin system Rv0910 family toxin [Mycolicibacter sinensis]|jgi:carbon monoxide dehydrogenase subunit G|uniref:Polyketide cyclase n=1 Tax=Mycolicibacter sinensis (strain JDM601) TaxID=875328 RepID=A0A1A2EBF6_MYCSD|nr:SRPBCC family protein [Mycolicibacter sinensis]OBF99313.1 polyketide cyclase [Mycolicibacter sinensis]OBG02497.1 polyketide cyclase [Mycolicibacter sinensis]